MDDALELAVEALGHALQPHALELRIPGRGHEHAHLSRAVCHALPPWKAAVASAEMRVAEEAQTTPSPGRQSGNRAAGEARTFDVRYGSKADMCSANGVSALPPTQFWRFGI